MTVQIRTTAGCATDAKQRIKEAIEYGRTNRNFDALLNQILADLDIKIVSYDLPSGGLNGSEVVEEPSEVRIGDFLFELNHDKTIVIVYDTTSNNGNAYDAFSLGYGRTLEQAAKEWSAK